MSVVARPIEAHHLGGLRALFERSGCACHCRYWHFEGTKNDWLLECATAPERNAEAFAADHARGLDSARGLVATEGDLVVGWLKLAPRASLAKLTRLPVYRSLPLGDDEDVWSIGCVLVDPDRRRRGAARELVRGAVAAAHAAGKILEAYPFRDASGDPEHAWRVPHDLLIAEGFRALDGPAADVIGRDAGMWAYPVLRRD